MYRWIRIISPLFVEVQIKLYDNSQWQRFASLTEGDPVFLMSLKLRSLTPSGVGSRIVWCTSTPMTQIVPVEHTFDVVRSTMRWARRNAPALQALRQRRPSGWAYSRPPHDTLTVPCSDMQLYQDAFPHVDLVSMA